MNASLKVPSGTPVNGHNIPLDSKQNELAVGFYASGSAKYSVIPIGDDTEVGFDVAAGETEFDFVVTEKVPGAASRGIILFDVQNTKGEAIPQSQGMLEFTAVEPVAVESEFIFNQNTH